MLHLDPAKGEPANDFKTGLNWVNLICGIYETLEKEDGRQKQCHTFLRKVGDQRKELEGSDNG
jgi:hypothetical protein